MRPRLLSAPSAISFREASGMAEPSRRHSLTATELFAQAAELRAEAALLPLGELHKETVANAKRLERIARDLVRAESAKA